MESRKNRYQLDRLPLVLLIASLAITVVAESHAKVPIDNLFNPLYFGDLNVTEGKSFRIECHAELPIAWYKDDVPIENQMIRYGREKFNYTIRDIVGKGLKRKAGSTLTVSSAALRHRGKYQCNINNVNAHHLHVFPTPPLVDETQRFTSSLESDDDHEDQRMFDSSHEGGIVLPSTLLRFTTPTVTQSTHFVETAPEYDFEKSNEKIAVDEIISRDDIAEEKRIPDGFEEKKDLKSYSEKNIYNEGVSPEDIADEARILEEVRKKKEFPPEIPNYPEQFDKAEDVLPSASSTVALPSFTTIPHSPTHATTHSKHVVHTTHVVPSEVQTQNHLEIDPGKGQQLKAVYDDKEGYKLFPLTKALMLTCITELTSDADKVVWMKRVEVDGKEGEDDKMVFKNVNEISDLKGRYQIIPKEGKFIIDNARKEDAGNYSCSLGNLSYKFNAYSTVAVKVPPNSYVIEEEKLEIKCIVKGSEPKISWEFKPDNGNETKPIEANDHIKFEEYSDVEDAILVIEKAKMSDRGTYTCIGRNELMTDDEVRSESFVRVKDKLAALWPFLGICAEVFLLCAIILIYEKRRNKTDLDESDTDQSPDQKNDHKDSDVRHRK